MAQLPREGNGAFFPVTKKANPRAPDWKGQMMINGNLIKISGWYKTSAYGQFLSLAVDNFIDPKAKPNENGQQWPKEVRPAGNDPFDDNGVPF